MKQNYYLVNVKQPESVDFFLWINYSTIIHSHKPRGKGVLGPNKLPFYLMVNFLEFKLIFIYWNDPENNPFCFLLGKDTSFLALELKLILICFSSSNFCFLRKYTNSVPFFGAKIKFNRYFNLKRFRPRGVYFISCGGKTHRFVFLSLNSSVCFFLLEHKLTFLR